MEPQTQYQYPVQSQLPQHHVIEFTDKRDLTSSATPSRRTSFTAGPSDPMYIGKQDPMQNEAILLLASALDRQTNAFERQSAALTKSSLGGPGALGLVSFATTTFMLSTWNTGLLDSGTLKTVLPMAFWFGGFGQALAGIFEFCIGNTFGATAFVAYGCFWLAYSTLVEFAIPEYAAGTTTQEANTAVAYFLFMWLIFTTYMLIASLRQSVVLAGVFICLEVTFLLLCIGNFDPSNGCIKAAGYTGLCCATIAFYGSAAIVINSSWGPYMPIGAFAPPVAVNKAVNTPGTGNQFVNNKQLP